MHGPPNKNYSKCFVSPRSISTCTSTCLFALRLDTAYQLTRTYTPCHHHDLCKAEHARFPMASRRIWCVSARCMHRMDNFTPFELRARKRCVFGRWGRWGRWGHGDGGGANRVASYPLRCSSYQVSYLNSVACLMLPCLMLAAFK